MENQKTCTTCNQPKQLDEFVKDKNKADGHGCICLSCNRARLKLYRANNLEQSRAQSRKWNAANKDRLRETTVAWKQRMAERNRSNGPAVTEKKCPKCGATKSADQFYKSATTATGLNNRCKQCAAEDQSKWRAENPTLAEAKDARSWEKYRSRYQANYKKWISENREQRKLYRREHHAKRVANDANYRIGHAIRGRIFSALRGIRKSQPTERLIGCTFDELARHIEKQWEPWMSWRNWGFGDGMWHIDHIVPCAAFDLTSTDEQRCCFHYTNLRPLCSKKNREKWYHYDPSDLDALRKRVLCLNV